LEKFNRSKTAFSSDQPIASVSIAINHNRVKKPHALDTLSQSGDVSEVGAPALFRIDEINRDFFDGHSNLLSLGTRGRVSSAATARAVDQKKNHKMRFFSEPDSGRSTRPVVRRLLKKRSAQTLFCTLPPCYIEV
jgi:hypothetical protein